MSWTFSIGAGLRIHGGWSRTESAKQSFRLYFRGQYGASGLENPLFGTASGQTYNHLVLRGGYNDGWPCDDVPWCQGEAVYVRDQLVRDLHRAMGQVAARGRWAALYLNGVYWGLYNLTERIDENFLVKHFDAGAWYAHSPSGELVPGSAYRWHLFTEWLTGTDLSVAAQYEQVVRQLNIENFTSYFLLNIWAQNQDWPDRNWIVARPRAGPDRRWRFLVWDAEATFTNEGNTFERVVTGETQLGQMLTGLLQNAQYRTYFAAQVERHLAGALASESVRSRLTALAAELRPAIAAEAARWRPEQEPATTVAQWEEALERLSDSLTANGQRLRHLSDLEKLRQQIPPRPLPEAMALLPPDTRIALLVGFPTVLAKGDAAVVAHLAARGAKVNVIGIDYAGHHDPAQVAASHDLLLISSSIRALDTAARYAQTPPPLIFWAPRLLAATGAPLSPRGGTRSQQTDIRIVDADHPITAGLPVDQPLRVVRRPDTFSVAWPRRGPGVQSLAKHLLGGDYAILVAEAGAELANGQPVQARTVFLYWHHDTFHRGTGEAVRLFDRVVDWTLSSFWLMGIGDPSPGPHPSPGLHPSGRW